MKANVIQTNFTGGEISPLMYGRLDVNKYANGASVLKNMIVRPQGGVCRRPGSKYVASTKANAATRLIKFIVSNQLTYVLEFGNLFIRFYTNGGVVTSGGNPVEVVTPYLSTELDQIYVTQSADVMYIAHPLHPPQVLTRTDNTTWTLTEYVPLDGPYLDIDISNNKAQFFQTSDTVTMTVTVGATAGTISIKAHTGVFDATSVGKYLLNQYGYQDQPLIYIESWTTSTNAGAHYVLKTDLIYPGLISMSFNAGVLTSGSDLFTAACVGKLVFGGGTTWFKVTGYTNARSVTATTISTISCLFTVTTVGYFNDGVTIGTSSVGKFVEYIIGGYYYLAEVLAVNSTTEAVVRPVTNIKLNNGEFDLTTNTAAGVVAGQSSYTSLFSSRDLGRYIRGTNAYTWMLINKVETSSLIKGTPVTVVDYNYPITVMSLKDDRLITGTLQFTEPTLSPTDVGIPIRLQFGSQWRCFRVTSVVSPTQAVGTLDDYLPCDTISCQNPYNAGIADSYRLNAWSVTNGFPSVVGIYEQRLVWANNTIRPSTLWFSNAADYTNMAPTAGDATVVADNSIYATIASGNVDPITWFRSGQVLLVGTTSGEYKIAPSGTGGISATNIAVTPQSYYGSLAPTVAYKFGVATLFIQRAGNKLREMVYQFQFDSFNSKDISVISEHIMRVRGGAKCLDYQVDPVSVFWIVCNNGDLVSVTYDRDQEICAFTQHTLAGGTAESVCVVPNTTKDDVYLVVKRTINGSIVRYIEMLSPLFDTDSGDTLSTMTFLDCYQTYSGTPATTISGLSYLRGQSVYAIADGALVGPFTVSAGGTITLATAASTVNVGLTYTSVVGSLSHDGGSQTGTSQGKRKRISEMSVRVKDSLPFKHGPDLNKLTQIDTNNFIADLNDLGTAGALVSGDSRFSVDMAWDTQAKYFLVQDMPYPMTVVAIMPILQSNE